MKTQPVNPQDRTRPVRAGTGQNDPGRTRPSRVAPARSDSSSVELRDWEALSAYLDGALEARQRAQLEARLRQDAGLRTALQELRRTRTVLRSQPRLRAPRNFYLTPQMAGIQTGRKAQPSAFPILRLASLLATIFFVVALVGDLVGRSAQPVVMVQSSSNAVPWPGGMGGGGGAEGPGFGGEVQMKEAEVASEAAPAEQLPAVADTLPAEQLTETTATPTPDATAEAALPEGKLPPADQIGRQPAAAGLTWPLLRVLQALLALLAVVCGVGAWYLRRAARH